MKALVTGASGLLGEKLLNVLSRECEVVPTHNTHATSPRSKRMDITNREGVYGVLQAVRPDVVVHAAAETRVDKCETDNEWAWNINAIGTNNIAEACAKIGAKLVYISTDYVFDGNKGRYTETDETNPINYYGFTKLEGEKAVRKLCRGYVIARTSVLYGWQARKLNIATWVIDSLRNERTISLADDHYGSPMLADDLAQIVLAILRKKAVGTYNAAGAERISRFEFALKIADAFGLDQSLIKRGSMEDIKTWTAKRPRDSSLRVDKLLREICARPMALNDALAKMKHNEKNASDTDWGVSEESFSAQSRP